MRPLARSEPWTIASAVNENVSVGQSDTIVLSDLARVQAALDDLTARTPLMMIGIASRDLPAEGTVTGTDETPQAARSRGVFAAR